MVKGVAWVIRPSLMLNMSAASLNEDTAAPLMPGKAGPCEGMRKGKIWTRRVMISGNQRKQRAHRRLAEDQVATSERVVRGIARVQRGDLEFASSVAEVIQAHVFARGEGDAGGTQHAGEGQSQEAQRGHDPSHFWLVTAQRPNG